MAMDPNQPYQPQYQQQYAPPAQGRWGTSTLGNLGAEIMAGLAYVIAVIPFLGFIGQIIIFAMEKNRFVKFHAAQALLLGIVEVVLSIAWGVVNGVLGAGASSSSGAISTGSLGLAGIFACVAGLLFLVLFIFWIWGMIAAFTGKPTKLPIVGSMAEGLAGGPVSAI
ncbi:MAG TPA: DUF4870 domain-containing protein [Ktedonobacterales bacterium]